MKSLKRVIERSLYLKESVAPVRVAGGKKTVGAGGHGKEFRSELRNSEAKGMERWSEEEDGAQRKCRSAKP